MMASVRKRAFLGGRNGGVACLVVLVAACQVFGLIMMIPGDQPWENGSTPQGSEAVANLPTRVGGWVGPPFGGGEYHFSYQCDETSEFNEALAVFAKIRAPRVELYVHDGPGRDFMLDPRQGDDKRGLVIDWRFTVWTPESFHRLYNDPRQQFMSDHEYYRQRVPAPRIDVYVHKDGAINWSEVKIPDRVVVIDQRSSAAPVKPEGGSVVQANVYDMATGQPVADALLRLVRAESATSQPAASQPAEMRAEGDEDGRVLMRNIPSGAFRVFIEAAGYAPRPCLWLNDNEPTYHGLDVELSKAVAISGVVVGDDGKPVNGVKVVADPIMGIDGRGYGRYGGENPVAETDENGEFEIYPVPKGYAGLRCRSEVYFAGPVPLMAVPAENVQIKVSATGVVRGRVTVGEDQRRPEEIHVSINPPGDPAGKWGGSMRCDADGRFEFQRVPPGEYLLHAPGAIPGMHNEGGVSVTVKPGCAIEVAVPYGQ